MKKIIAVAFLLLTLGGAVFAADPKTIETDWMWDFHYTKCTGVTSCTADVAGLGAGVSKSTQNVVGFSWSILSVGGDATFTISQVKRVYGTGVGDASAFTNPSPQSWYGTAPLISTTTAAVAPQGVTLNGDFKALTTNPFFTLSSLDEAATTFLWVEFGRKKN